jgi:hypothetical protein
MVIYLWPLMRRNPSVPIRAIPTAKNVNEAVNAKIVSQSLRTDQGNSDSSRTSTPMFN